MAVETDEFIVDGATFNYIQSSEITGNRMSPAPVKGGLNSATVICKGCHHTWTSRQFGEGNFFPYLGGVLLECPSCSNQGNVANKLLADI